MGSHMPQVLLGFSLAIASFRTLFSMQWHFGVSSILNSIMLAGVPLMDVLTSMFTLLFVFSFFLTGLFGIVNGNATFRTLATSLTHTTLISFGLMEYHDVVSMGFGPNHGGLGSSVVELNSICWWSLL